MTTNAEIRRLARTWMKGHWGKAILIALILFAITFALQSSISLIFAGTDGILNKFKLSGILNIVDYIDSSYLDDPSQLQNAFSFAPLVSSVFSFLLITPLTIGANYIFFLNAARAANPKIQNMFKGYRIYGRALGVAFMKGLFIALWFLMYFAMFFIMILIAGVTGTDVFVVFGLLVLIAGIIHVLIKTISYSLAEYFIVENPKESITGSIELSKGNMYGNKGRLLGLMISIYWPVIVAVVIFAIILFVFTQVVFLTAPATLALTLVLSLSLEALIMFCNIYFYASQAHFYLNSMKTVNYNGNDSNQRRYVFYGKDLRSVPPPNIEPDNEENYWEE